MPNRRIPWRSQKHHCFPAQRSWVVLVRQHRSCGDSPPFACLLRKLTLDLYNSEVVGPDHRGHDDDLLMGTLILRQCGRGSSRDGERSVEVGEHGVK